jgi:hypothetical protein
MISSMFTAVFRSILCCHLALVCFCNALMIVRGHFCHILHCFRMWWLYLIGYLNTFFIFTWPVLIMCKRNTILWHGLWKEKWHTWLHTFNGLRSPRTVKRLSQSKHWLKLTNGSLVHCFNPLHRPSSG